MSDRGSALVLALVVLTLLTFLGVALLTLCQHENRMAHADARAKSAFYHAEAGLEHARRTLVETDAASASPGSLDDELLASAGLNGSLDFDPETIRAVYDSTGRVVGFTGHGDDVPLLTFTAFGRGAYAAFLRNDGLDDAFDPLDDTNARVVIAAVGAGPGRSLEVVEALVRRLSLPAPPAAITLLGPAPEFSGGTSAAKRLIGDDCDGAGEPGLYVPVVGVLGSAAETAAEQGVWQPSTYTSGSSTGVDTVTDINGTVLPLWKDCSYMLFLASQTKASADVLGDSSTPTSVLGTPGARKTVYIDGDYTLSGSVNGAGTLWVTGTLTLQGGVDWEGSIYAVGRGIVERAGGGNGMLSGALVVANVAGDDDTFGTADDCSGGYGAPTFETAGGGNGTIVYCTHHAVDNDGQPFRVVQFRQR